jgi:DNA recombination protein RmuC
VLLFIPSEAAFQLAFARDAALYEEALHRRVVLCSPWTLLAALQLIAHLWRQEKQSAHAQQIAEEAGRLLEKLGAFVADLDQVGLRLRQAQQSFDGARAKLTTGRGNVLKRAADIAKLGARARPDRAQALVAAGDGADEEESGLEGALPPGAGSA